MAFLDQNPTNAELVRAMQSIATHDTPENRLALYQTLLESELLVPIVNPLGHGKKVGLQQVIGQTEVEFIVAQNKHDQNAMLAFTDAAAVQAWKPAGTNYIATNGVDLFRMALEMNVASILLNIAGPTARGELMRWEFQALAAGIIPQSADQVGTTVVTPPPDAPVKFSLVTQKPSNALVNALRDAMMRHSEISAGYLLQAEIGASEPHLVGAVRISDKVDEETLRKIMNDLGDRVSPYLPKDEFIDFIVLGESDAVPVSDTETIVFQRS